MKATIITASIIITLALVAYIAYEMAHAYELPDDEVCTTETKDSKETRK